MDSGLGRKPHDEELKQVQHARSKRGCPEGDPEKDLFGIAFSGGGIRSATFNLGVLQALAKHKLLSRADFLSTVSGGGYIGSWLQAWISRSTNGVADVESALRGPVEPKQVSWLRRYSNYLTPRLGFFGADTWTVIAIYLRNLLLTQTVLVSGIVLALTAAWALFGVVRVLGASDGAGWFSLVAMIGLALFAFRQLGSFKPRRAGRGAQAAVQTRIVLPIVGVAVLASVAVVVFDRMGVVSWASTFGGLFLAGSALAASTARTGGEKGPTLDSRTILEPRVLFGAAVGGAVAGAILGWIVPCAATWRLATCAVFLPPIIVALFALASTVQIGVSGRTFSDSSFEWWGRLGGWMFIYAIGWLLLMGLALFGDSIFRCLWDLPGSLPAWVATWAGGLAAGTSKKDRPSGEQSKVRGVLAAIAPYGFVAGLLLLIASGFDHIVNSASTSMLLLVVVVALLIVWFFGQINRLSMHGLYRNRLVRCYLGASNPEREQDAFTGFSPGDDVKLADLPTDAGPYPIVNTAVNLASSENLAWQERKASSFIFTPEISGFGGAYRPTRHYGGGYTLGSALAISGAAVSPNMGFRTTPAFAFLLSMFNVRLGWWTGNPRDDDTWEHQAPNRFAFGYLLRELLGMASADSEYVYLSDGGHFENLGIYELVKRRCRNIIVCDAGCDGSFQFDDLGNAVRKCRTDFGADIRIDVEQLVPGENGRSARHCAVGTIRYRDGSRGTIVYLKPSLSGDEPADVRNYAAENATFPHQTTGDQWFAESQFESYRKLGQHIAHKALERASLVDTSLTQYFTDLRYQWVAPASASTATFARHAGALDALVRQLRDEPALAYLDESFWPEWETVAGDLVSVPQRKTTTRRKTNSKLTAEQFRSGFYFCQSLIQLMESVFLDLGLDDPEQRAHPDNRGWINLFRHFSWAGMFRLAWAVGASTHGVRFQNFCKDALQLGVGDEFELVEHKMNAGQPSTARRRWSALLNRAKELNFHEKDLLQKMFGQPGFDPKDGALALYTFRIQVQDGSDRLPETGFPCGFAVVQAGKRKKDPVHLRVLRIPDHLRKMGLARQALRALCDLPSGRPMLEEPPVPKSRTKTLAAEPDSELAIKLRQSRPALQRILDSIET